MKKLLATFLFVLPTILTGCGTPEGERLQLVGEWQVNLSDLLVASPTDDPAASGEMTDEQRDRNMHALVALRLSSLTLQRNGVAILIASVHGRSDVPLECVKTGTWEITGTGEGRKFKLNFPAAVLTNSSAPPDLQNATIALISASLPQGEGKWTPIIFDTPDEFGNVNKFRLLLPSSTRDFERAFF